MVRFFREYRNTVVKYKQFPSHLRKKKFFLCLQWFSFLGEKNALQFTFFSGNEYVNYFNFFHLGLENIDLFQLSPRF